MRAVKGLTTRIAIAAGAAGGLLAGWVGFPAVLYERVEQPASFSHAIHTGDEVGMTCEDCHGFDASGRFGKIPSVRTCAECHGSPLKESEAERILVEKYIEPQREIPWLVYSRQPDNVHFPHAQHVRRAEIPCADCHGDHALSDELRFYERNRITGLSRDVWGPSMTRLGNAPGEGMKMSDCVDCHRENDVVDSCQSCHR
ncbi:MAG: menaquinone reductase multiheme cytochrome c subunit QrcA [Polyangia bacterium]